MSALQRRQHKKDLHSGPGHARSAGQPDSSDAEVRSRIAGISDSEGIDFAVAHGVELGYRVIDQYLRQGQLVAEHLNSRDRDNVRARDSDTVAGDPRQNLEELVERLVHLSISLIPQWSEVEGALGWSRDFVRGLLSQWIPNPPDDVANDAAHPGDNGPIAVEVVSSRPIRVTLDLRPHCGRLMLMGEGMRAAEAGFAALGDVTIAGDEGERPIIRIRVADDQPAGTYTGSVAEAKSGEPCGTISVRVGA